MLREFKGRRTKSAPWNDGMGKMVIDEVILRHAERDIIKVTLDDGQVQPFYCSSGYNSGMPGTWLPFDGCYIIGGQVVWFDKRKYKWDYRLSQDLQTVEPHLDRYGTEELKAISDELAKMDIPKGIESTGEEVNKFLGYQNPLEINYENQTNS